MLQKFSNTPSLAKEVVSQDTLVNAPLGELPDWLTSILADSEERPAMQERAETSKGRNNAYMQVELKNGKKRVHEIGSGRSQIGRGRESTIFLEDPTVSRVHASIINNGDGSYAIKDEGSTHGIKVNGLLMKKGALRPLVEGDKIEIGQTVLIFLKR
ncbi:MAG: FHA domain-containing protein [Ktedonobacteraceae bacterium]|nr:FHA domain-containing protein [Ktedonobacteraceae bacterium]